MKTKLHLWLLPTFLLLLVPSGYGQGILNGGFELYDRQSGFLANWHVRFTRANQTKDLATTQNGVSGSTVAFNVEPESYPGVSINYLDGLGEPLNFKEGKYFLYADGWDGIARITLSQDTLVPDDANSLVYRAQNGYPNYIEVAINHVKVPFILKEVIVPEIPFGAVSDWWLDVSAYRGKTVNLDFTILSNVALDRIRFSSLSVPEPTAIGALVLASVALAIKRARNRARG